jgi:uncharacterized repeat protein (TIGR03803 family)
MDKPVYVGLATGKTFRLITGLILLVVAGRAFNANAQTVTNFHTFCTSCSDGGFPVAGLVQGSDGNFYGTASFGGTNSCDCGTVFRISSGGTYTSFYSFVGSPNDGDSPNAVLVQGSDGNFYGTTYYGGTGTNCGSFGCGTVFRISPSGSYTSFYSFVGSPNDGAHPYDAELLRGSDGNFYGTTSNGGTNNLGTVFRINASGGYTNLYFFVGSPNDGGQPKAGLVQGSDGNLYGTTFYGGTSTNCSNGCGTVFRISTSGNYSNLYSFTGRPNDGATPWAGLVQGRDGNLYGTTFYGGTSTNCSLGCGTVFRISLSGNYTNLYSFIGYPKDGDEPTGGLVQGSDGNFYGITQQGGGNGVSNGTIFRIGSTGNHTNLYSFGIQPSDGLRPWAGLVQGSDGNFYGTTSQGGSNSCKCGTVFKLTVPLNPPANQISAVQISGNDVNISIPSVAYETYQLQFSGSMTPTNWVNVPVSVTNSIGALLTLTNFGGASQPHGFYRFDITP